MRRRFDEALLDTRTPAEFALAPDGVCLALALQSTVDDAGRHFPSELWLGGLNLPAVRLADGRNMKYVVAAPPIEVDKDQVGPRRAELFDQSHSYGPAGKPRSGRLLLLSCGGTFDNRTGHYESNIFVYALPA